MNYITTDCGRWPSWFVYIAWMFIILAYCTYTSMLGTVLYQGSIALTTSVVISTGVTTLVQELVAKPGLVALLAFVDTVMYKQRVSPVMEYRSFIRPGMDKIR